jgi:GTP cyclohydrolase I/GTP cyclohydrolase-4
MEPAGPDVQASAPAVPVSLSRVGVTGMEKVIRIGAPGARHPQLYSARVDCYVDLGPDQKGAHMSRFDEVIDDAIGQVILGEVGLRAEHLAQRIAERVRERQNTVRAEVTITARYPEHKPAPVSGITTQEIYTLHASAVASEHGTRRIAGVTAQGMIANPGTQRLVAEDARKRLAAEGFSGAQIGRILATVPLAADSERGLGTLHIGCPEDCDIDIDAAALLTIIEDSMSSEIYELLKRSDEGAVVEKAHRRPRFVEDCVRAMLRGVLDLYDDLPEDAFISSHQENIGTIHQHNVMAVRFGLVGELRAEHRTGVASLHHTSRREWLEAIGVRPPSDRPSPRARPPHAPPRACRRGPRAAGGP